MDFKRKNKLIGLSYEPASLQLSDSSIDSIKLNDHLNCITGNSFSGKSRIIRLILNMVNVIKGVQAPFRGNTTLVFGNNLGQKIKYQILINPKNEIQEFLWLDESKMMQRNSKKANPVSGSSIRIDSTKTIFSITEQHFASELIGDIRSWAERVHIFDPKLHVWDNVTLLYYFKNKDLSLQKILNEALPFFSNFEIDFMIKAIEESGTENALKKYPIKLQKFLSITLGLTKLLNEKQTGTFLLDDLTAGLSYEVANKMAQLCKDVSQYSDIQIIATSTNPYFLDNIPLEKWVLIKQHDHTIFQINFDLYRTKINNFILSETPKHKLLQSAFIQNISL